MAGPRRVYVVIANLMLAERVLRALPEAGGSGVLAASVHEVTAAPGPVVLDLDHERLDALAFLGELRSHPAGIRLPVLAYGAHVRPQALAAAEGMGALALPRSAFSGQLESWLRRIVADGSG